jgi:TRAP-type C4-dicarboxylate transport system permease small subunit
MTFLAAARRALDQTLQGVLILLMISMTVIVVLGVVYRKLGASLSWYDEIAAINLAWVTYYGAAYAALKRAHIGFEGLINVMPMGLRMAAVFAAEILVIGFFVLLAWMGLKVLHVLKGDGLVSLPWMPLQLTQSVIPIGAVLFIAAQLLSFPAYLATARAGTLGKHDIPEAPKESLQ